MIVRTKFEGSVDCVAKAAELLRHCLRTRNKVDRDKEHFFVIGMDTKRHLKYVEIVTIGTLDASLVHPREVFRMAIMQGVASIIIGHNHPSGDLTPSREDRMVTERLAKAGELLGIELTDHLIVGMNEHRYSFRESMPDAFRGIM